MGESLNETSTELKNGDKDEIDDQRPFPTEPIGCDTKDYRTKRAE